MDGCMVGWLDGWMDGWMDEFIMNQPQLTPEEMDNILMDGLKMVKEHFVHFGEKYLKFNFYFHGNWDTCVISKESMDVNYMYYGNIKTRCFFLSRCCFT